MVAITQKSNGKIYLIIRTENIRLNSIVSYSLYGATQKVEFIRRNQAIRSVRNCPESYWELVIRNYIIPNKTTKIVSIHKNKSPMAQIAKMNTIMTHLVQW